MILIDRREKPRGRDKEELAGVLRRLGGIPVETVELPYGDIAFSGKGEGGSSIDVGIERKRIGDVLACIDDSRLSGHQLIGLRQLYQERWLLIEGMWRPHDPKGMLMESRDGASWFECRPGGRLVMYAKLRRYLFSVQRAGIGVLFTRDLFQTAYDIRELYHYYQKREHTSMLEKQTINIPVLTSKPPLVYRWANEIDGIGVKGAQLAAEFFKTPIALACSEELEWMTLAGIGPKSATDFVRQIQGKKR